MPALGVAQQTGTLLKWLKAEGESVSKGEPLMEIETDKSTVEIEAAASGVLGRVAAKVGDEVPVGQTIALILAPGEALPTKQEASEAAPVLRSRPQGEGSGEGHVPDAQLSRRFLWRFAVSTGCLASRGTPPAARQSCLPTKLRPPASTPHS